MPIQSILSPHHPNQIAHRMSRTYLKVPTVCCLLPPFGSSAPNQPPSSNHRYKQRKPPVQFFVQFPAPLPRLSGALALRAPFRPQPLRSAVRGCPHPLVCQPEQADQLDGPHISQPCRQHAACSQQLSDQPSRPRLLSPLLSPLHSRAPVLLGSAPADAPRHVLSLESWQCLCNQPQVAVICYT
jgi:hypothetical protein